MLGRLKSDNCLYQDDVVDFLIKSGNEALLKENADGNLVLGSVILKAFRKLTESNVVWVRSGFYWRNRVPEDGPGREAKG